MSERSRDLFSQARQVIPGGVNSPVRAFKSVGRDPVFVARAGGCQIFDVDGKSYIDYVGSWGPMILGHAHPEVIAAIKDAADRGTSFGAPTENEVLLAQKIVQGVPSVEMVRLVNSGTEAVISAIRVARAYTGKDKILKMAGCYHGHDNSMLVKAGSGAITLGIPDSPGVPAALAQLTLTVPYNDLAAVEQVLRKEAGQIACLIVEPVAGNMGVIPPAPGYLQGLRDLTSQYGVLLIFDEVITGFRLAFGGAQSVYGVIPDMTCLGKIIGGGLPVGAYGGKRQIMEIVAPSGPVYQAGTLSGNPLAVAAGLKTLELLEDDAVYAHIDQITGQLCRGLQDQLQEFRIPCQLNRVGSLFTLFFTQKKVTDYDSAKSADTERFSRYFRVMLEEGIYLPPSQFEALFVSMAHTEREVEKTLEASERALHSLSQ
ncbi:MAG TPA: glutamate-1-semialdehyde 2,1-aminomutase [bacterium]|nr:glutamate-1-semialdehyde 2,1-aminomutase [bacterium]